MGYRNWRQRWCKKEGNKVLRKGKILHLAHVNVTEPKEVLIIGFFLFSKPCSPSFYTTFAPIPIPHQLSRQRIFTCFLYFFYYHFLFYCPLLILPPPPPRFNYRHEQMPAFICGSRGVPKSYSQLFFHDIL